MLACDDVQGAGPGPVIQSFLEPGSGHHIFDLLHENDTRLRDDSTYQLEYGHPAAL